MQCYKHHDRAAVGVCRGCGKGLCAEGCVEDLGFGLSCGGECSIRIGHIEALNHKAGAAYTAGRRYLWSVPLLIAIMGGVFLYSAWLEYQGGRDYWFTGTFGLLWLLAALALYLRNRMWARAIR